MFGVVCIMGEHRLPSGKAQGVASPERGFESHPVLSHVAEGLGIGKPSGLRNHHP